MIIPLFNRAHNHAIERSVAQQFFYELHSGTPQMVNGVLVSCSDISQSLRAGDCCFE